jgi:hypothetical protein
MAVSIAEGGGGRLIAARLEAPTEWSETSSECRKMEGRTGGTVRVRTTAGQAAAGWQQRAQRLEGR